MKKVYNCFVKNKGKECILFNPYSFATVIAPNPNMLNEEEFITNISDEDKKFLNENGIFMEERERAYAIGRYFSDMIKYGKTITISDAYSFSCNMDCIYCFENGTKEINKSQTKEMRLEEIIKIINLYVDNIEIIDYIFFGGEPLLNLEYMEYIAKGLVKQYPQKKIKFSVTSNGTLIDDKFISLCNQFKFEEIRITMDGPKCVHNARRRLKNGMDSYTIIMNNIKKLCDKTNILININTVIDNQNYNKYNELYLDINKKIGKYVGCEGTRIVFNVGMLCHPLIDTNYTLKNGEKNKYGNEKYYNLCLDLIRKGATITSPFYATQCLNSSEKTFIIAPIGDVYKCITGIGCKRFLLATYEELQANANIFYENNIIQIENSHRAECRNCEYIAMCNGGCKCQHYENHDILCRKQILNEEMESLLDLLYEGTFTREGFFKKRKEINE